MPEQHSTSRDLTAPYRQAETAEAAGTKGRAGILKGSMRTLKGVYFWCMATVVTLLLFLLIALKQAVAKLQGRAADGRPAHGVAALWGRTLIRLMPGWTIDVEGMEHLPEDHHPMVIVANHESMADIWGMYYLGIQFRWLSKDSVFKIPVIGQAMRWCNYVPVNRASRSSAHEAMAESSKRIRQGLSMFFFPEGTRSLDGQVKAFKVGAFKLARDEQVAVLPVAIHGAAGLLPKHSWIPGKARIQIRVLPPLTAPTADEDLEAYAERARALIITAHRELV